MGFLRVHNDTRVVFIRLPLLVLVIFNTVTEHLNFFFKYDMIAIGVCCRIIDRTSYVWIFRPHTVWKIWLSER